MKWGSKTAPEPGTEMPPINTGNVPDSPVELILSNEEKLDAVNRPWIEEVNPKFEQLGKELLQPVKEMLDFSTLARKVFACREVKPGEVVRYDRDPYIPAYLVNDKGEVEKRTEGRYVYPEEFEVVAYPSMPKGMYADYELAEKELAKVQEKAMYSLVYQEDDAAIKLLTEVGKTNKVVEGNLIETLDGIIDAFNPNRLICDKVLLNRNDVRKLTKEAVDGDLKNKIDPVNQRELVLAGYVGTYRNAMLITTAQDTTEEKHIENLLLEGQPIGVTAPEYLGGMPIRVELFSEVIRESGSEGIRNGWFWYELISMLVTNPNAVVLGQIKY